MINKKKLVILSAFYEPYMSGAEQMVKQVAEKLGGRRETYLITGRFNKSLPKTEKRENFILIRVGIGHKQADKLLYIFLAAWETRKIKPHIVHAIMESYAGGALFLVKYFYPRAKRILTLQSGDLDDPKKQKQLIINFFFKKIHTSPNIITAISTFLAARAERLGVPKGNIHITPNGLDFSEIPESVVKEENRVVCVARLSWEKGLDYLIKAWAEVVKEIPDAVLYMVGEGKEREGIEKMIVDLNLNNSVRLLGNLSHSQTLEEIKKSEIFCCPSLAEGLGNVFIEAQACGVPPIGTRVGGIPDVIQDGENGLLIEPKNSNEIKNAILKLLRDKELTERLSEKGLTTSKKFDWNKILENIDVIYDKISK